MPFTFFCDRCGQSIEAEKDLAGTALECPGCESSIIIPAPVAPPKKSKKSLLIITAVIAAVSIGGLGLFIAAGFKNAETRKKEKTVAYWESLESILTQSKKTLPSFSKGYKPSVDERISHHKKTADHSSNMADRIGNLSIIDVEPEAIAAGESLRNLFKRYKHSSAVWYQFYQDAKGFGNYKSSPEGVAHGVIAELGGEGEAYRNQIRGVGQTYLEKFQVLRNNQAELDRFQNAESDRCNKLRNQLQSRLNIELPPLF